MAHGRIIVKSPGMDSMERLKRRYYERQAECDRCDKVCGGKGKCVVYTA